MEHLWKNYKAKILELFDQVYQFSEDKQIEVIQAVEKKIHHWKEHRVNCMKSKNGKDSLSITQETIEQPCEMVAETSPINHASLCSTYITPPRSQCDALSQPEPSTLNHLDTDREPEQNQSDQVSENNNNESRCSPDILDTPQGSSGESDAETESRIKTEANSLPVSPSVLTSQASRSNIKKDRTVGDNTVSSITNPRRKRGRPARYKNVCGETDKPASADISAVSGSIKNRCTRQQRTGETIQEDSNGSTPTKNSPRSPLKKDSTTLPEIESSSLEKTDLENTVEPGAVVKRKPGRPPKKKPNQDEESTKSECDVCGRVLCNVNALKVHMRIHSGEKPYACSTCGKKFAQLSGLRLHEKYHRGKREFRCAHCDYRGYQKVEVIRHEWSRHLNYKPFKCDVCNKGFITADQLSRHKTIHDRNKEFLCDKCDFITHNWNILRTHQRNMHTPDRRMYTCEICNAVLRYKDSFAMHMRRHNGEKPCICDICDKGFTSSSQVAAHKKTHAPRAHMCESCGKSFMSKAHLIRHSVIHSGEKCFSCPYCTYRCNVQTNLKKHCRACHNVEYPPKIRSTVTVVKKPDTDTPATQNESSVVDAASRNSNEMTPLVNNNRNVDISGVTFQVKFSEDANRVITIGNLGNMQHNTAHASTGVLMTAANVTIDSQADIAANRHQQIQTVAPSYESQVGSILPNALTPIQTPVPAIQEQFSQGGSLGLVEDPDLYFVIHPTPSKGDS